MNNLIAISDARANLPDLVTQINKQSDRAVITVNGQPKVVMISIEELESLEETAEILTISGIKEDIKRSKKQFYKGQFVSLSDLPK